MPVYLGSGNENMTGEWTLDRQTADPRIRVHSPYSYISRAMQTLHCLQTNNCYLNWAMFPVQIISCRYITYDVASNGLKYRSEMKKSLKKHIVYKMPALRAILCASYLRMPLWPFCGRTDVIFIMTYFRHLFRWSHALGLSNKFGQIQDMLTIDKRQLF